MAHWNGISQLRMYPVAAQSSITKNLQQLRRFKEQFFRRNSETKRIGDPGDDIKTDANVGCIEERTFAHACLSWSIEIFGAEFTWSKRDSLEKRESRTEPFIELSVSPVSEDVGCQAMSED